MKAYTFWYFAEFLEWDMSDKEFWRTSKQTYYVQLTFFLFLEIVQIMRMWKDV
jgi:hypothetical protein